MRAVSLLRRLAGPALWRGGVSDQTHVRRICQGMVPGLLAARGFGCAASSVVSLPGARAGINSRLQSAATGRPWGLASFPNLAAVRGSVRGVATEAAVESEAPTKRRKTVTWYGARISTDPTTPSVIRRRPTTPSQRHTAIIDKTYLWRGKPLKALTKGIQRSGGRNNQGVTTVWGKGGGNKRRYRLIDFKRVQFKSTGVVTGVVERIEYDPNRTALIALLRHPPQEGYVGEKLAAYSYIVSPRGIAVGTTLEASRTESLDVKPGNAMPLRHIPVGTLVHNIEMRPGCFPACSMPSRSSREQRLTSFRCGCQGPARSFADLLAHLRNSWSATRREGSLSCACRLVKRSGIVECVSAADFTLLSGTAE